MPARLIAYPPEHAAIVRKVGRGGILRIGRGPDNELRVDHPSVSRVHAQLQACGEHWQLSDLGSKNGTFAEGHAVAAPVVLEGGCWLRFGDVYAEFSLPTAAELAAEERGQRARRAAATAHTARIGRLDRLEDLLDGSLRSVLELAQCGRGFLLLGGGSDLRVRCSASLDPARLAGREFAGSIGVVRRSLAERAPVVVNDVAVEGWLSARESVAVAGIRALVCLPLMEGERVLGAIYADRTGVGPPITTLDLDLLQAFTERAAVWIAARQASEQLAQQSPRWDRILAAHGGPA